MTTFKNPKTIPCLCCGEETAKLKYEKSRFFYACDKCMSEFVTPDCAEENIRLENIMGNCCNHDCSQGKYCARRNAAQTHDNFLNVFLVIVVTFAISYFLIWG